MCHFVLADSNHAEKCLDVIWFILNYVAFLYKETVCNQFEYLEGHDEVRVWTMQTLSLLQAPKVWTQHLLFWGGKLVDTGFHWALKAKMHYFFYKTASSVGKRNPSIEGSGRHSPRSAALAGVQVWMTGMWSPNSNVSSALLLVQSTTSCSQREVLHLETQRMRKVLINCPDCRVRSLLLALNVCHQNKGMLLVR